jgi:hypothetical protein
VSEYRHSERIEELEGEVARLGAENAAQLEELRRISDALGTNEGHSSVDHILALRAKVEELQTLAKASIDATTKYMSEFAPD